MTPLPLQRTSPDRRTVLLHGSGAIAELCLVARATGWSLWSATARDGAVRLPLARD